MRYNTAEDRNSIAAQEALLEDQDNDSLPGGLTHARILRTIGHDLERHRVVNCDLTVDDAIYTITGLVQPPSKPPRSFLRSARKLFFKDDQMPCADRITNRILLHYSMADIQVMEAQVRDQRSGAPETSDPLGMSQLLRVIGGFIDRRAGDELLGLWIDDRWVTITHVSRDHRLLKTTHDIEFFYDLWVKMYLRRSNRMITPPPSGPTICIGGRPPSQSAGYLR
jgi:hypothetical protein